MIQGLYKLKIIQGNDVDSIFEIDEGVFYDFKRAPSDGMPANLDRKDTIFLRDHEISKHHARLNIVAGDLVVEDLDSTNGVFINDRKIKKSLLQLNDKLKMGTTIFLVEPGAINLADARTFIGIPSDYSKPTHDFKKLSKILDDKQIIFEPDLTGEPPFAIETEAFKTYIKILDLVDKNADIETEIQITDLVSSYFFEVTIFNNNKVFDRRRFYRSSIIIGRVGDLWLEDEAVSREHAMVSVMGGGLFKVKDLNSQNGVYIKDKRVQVSSFSENEDILIGNTKLRFSYINDDI